MVDIMINIKNTMKALETSKQEIDKAYELLNRLYITLSKKDDTYVVVNKNIIIDRLKKDISLYSEIFNKPLFGMDRWGPLYISIQKVLNDKVCLILGNKYKWEHKYIQQCDHKTGFLNVFKNVYKTGSNLIISLINIEEVDIAQKIYKIIYSYYKLNI